MVDAIIIISSTILGLVLGHFAYSMWRLYKIKKYVPMIEVDAKLRPETINLPENVIEGTTIAIKKIDDSDNPVTITCGEKIVGELKEKAIFVALRKRDKE